jgi:hypothetical protein
MLAVISTGFSLNFLKLPALPMQPNESGYGSYNTTNERASVLLHHRRI